MAAIRASRILVTVPIVLIAVLAALYAVLSSSAPTPITTAICTAIPFDVDYLGPPLTKIERAAISNSQGWIQVKRQIRAGDTVHQFSEGARFGYAVMRGKCFIVKVTEGIA